MGTPVHDEIPWLDSASREEVARVVEALYRVHSLATAVTDIDSLLVRISQEAKDVARAEAASVMLFDENTQELYFRTALGDSGDQDALKREVRLTLSQGIAGATAASRASINVHDAQGDARFYREADAASRFETRNLLAVPMIDHDQLVGVLEVLNKSDGGDFTDFDTRVMEMFGSLAAAEVISARLIEEKVRNERLAAIGQAVTGLSHYIKNIVTGLTSSADLIDMGLDRQNIEVLQRSWPVFRRSTKRIANFVQDMLSLSKPRKPVREACNLEEIIHDAHQTMEELFTQRKVDVVFDCQDVGGPVMLDAQAMHRCMLNLLGNAADAVEKTGGQVRIRVWRPDDEQVVIECEDTGPGVPDEHKREIFDMFFSTKGAKGTGLGLAATHKSIREHGGTIEVLDAPGGGACFRIVLPAPSVSESGQEERHPLLQS
ncbi:MAG: GAF domain-containing protein [Candidatus Hydrogenedens sp.]|nr:GAF domain-containing protein [Candidatus Hydrogenedens sp.]